MKAEDLRRGTGFQAVDLARDPTAGRGLRLDDTGKIPSSVLGSSLTGRISSAGAILGGSGFTASRTAAGKYTITFTSAYGAVPVFLGAPFQTTGYEILTLVSVTAAAASIGIVTSSGGAFTDTAFNFVVFPVL